MTYDEMQVIAAPLKTKSDKIRKLWEVGVEKAEIARFLGIRYQHVRNVLMAPTPHRSALPNSEQLPLRAKQGVDSGVGPLSIDQAKQGLALKFGVAPEAIEITIRG